MHAPTFMVLAIVTLAGCARQADIAAEERTIRDLGRRWVQAVAGRDTMTIGDVFAEDAEFLPQDAPRVSGRAAIRATWAAYVKTPNLSLTFEPTTVWVASAGDLAYETGAYHESFDGPKAQRVEDTGKYVVAWRKLGGVWKVQYDIFNSDKPAVR